MNSFTNKSIVQKILIALIFVILCNFIIPNFVHADKTLDETQQGEVEDEEGNIYGILFKPVQLFILGIADSTMKVVQYFMLGENVQWGKTYKLSEWEKIKERWSNPLYVGTALTMPSVANLWNLKNDGETQIFIPQIQYSVDKIISNKVPALDVNFINPRTYTIDEADGGQRQEDSVASKLRDIIRSWYISLRNIAIVGLLSILVYIGIRMVLSSAASDKAKYKNMIADWVIALCLVFCLHYIMVFALNITEAITDGIAGSGYINVGVELLNGDKETVTMTLTDLARYRLQDIYSSSSISSQFGYTVIYCVLVIYTITFTFMYLRRVVYMAFLTIIAPLVALTYPIDKLSDGKAQAFNMWLKEYTYNLLIQPVHLILYNVLIGSALDLAANNLVYALAAIAFLIPAEKIMKAMFNFKDGQTGKAVGSFATGALVANSINKLASGSKSSKGGSSSSSKNSSADTKNIRMKNNNTEDAIAGIAATSKVSSNDKPDNGNQEAVKTVSGQDNNGETLPADTSNTKNIGAGDSKVKTANGENNLPSGSNGKLSPEEVEKLKQKTTNTTTPIKNMSYKKNDAKNGKRNITTRQRLGNIGKVVGRRFTRKVFNKDTALGIGRTALKLAGAAAFGTAGLAAGLSTGDMSNVFTYSMGGIAAGNVIGGKAMDAGVNMAGDIKDMWQEGWYEGDEEGYRSAMQSRYDKNFMKNEENKKYLERVYGATKAKEVMSNIVPEYLHNNVTDIEQIVNAEKLREKYQEEEQLDEIEARRKAINMARQSQKIGDIYNDPKKLKERREDLKEQFMAQQDMEGKPISEKEAIRMANTTLKDTKTFFD